MLEIPRDDGGAAVAEPALAMTTRARILSIMVVGAGASIVALSEPSSAQPPPAKAAFETESVPLARDSAVRVKVESAFLFRGEFMIDADGAPRAYHPGYTCDASYK